MATPEPEPDDATKLAVERTRLAYDRTVLAWVRTAASLITFGFSVYKLFEITAPRSAGPVSAFGPREFGLTLGGLGVGALLLATFEYRRDMRALRAQYPVRHATLTLGVATVIGCLGLLAIVAMLMGW